MASKLIEELNEIEKKYKNKEISTDKYYTLKQEAIKKYSRFKIIIDDLEDL